MSIPDIIDNKAEMNLADAINSCLKSAELSKMAVGYFYLSGFNAIRDNLESVKKLKLLINNELEKRTFDEIQKGIELFQENAPPRFVDQKTRNKIKHNAFSEYSAQLEYIDQSEKAEDGIFTLYSLIKEGRVDIRVFTGGKLHAKLYLIDYHKD